MLMLREEKTLNLVFTRKPGWDFLGLGAKLCFYKSQFLR